MLFGLCYLVSGQDSKPVPLKNVVVEANVVDMIAEVAISQTYINIEDNAIEAIYRFPLHEAAAVCSFEAEVDGKRRIKGIVKESKEAVQEYNDAIQKGHGAYLLEELHPDIFECTVGNITCNQKVVIKITYVTELKHDSETERIRFVLPTHIAPRYQPSGFGFGPNYYHSPPHSVGIGDGFDLSISVTCRMTSTITSIESPSHHISTELNVDGDQKISRITYEENAKHLEKDFVLVVKSQGLDQPIAFVEYNPVTDTNCVMLTLVPKFSINSTITECIFVVDRSGSMNGEPIKKASQALELFVRSLPEDSFFNVISFGSQHSALFPGSQPNSQSSQSAAVHHAQQMQADMGGTEIYRCLEWVFSNTRSDMPTAIFLLTDGSVWNVDEIAELVRKNLESQQDNLRVFTLGIGSSVSHNLVESVARAGKGYSQYVVDNERMDRKVVGMLKNAVKPPIKDYKVNWTNDDLMEVEEVEEVVPEKEKPVISFFSDNAESPPHSPDDFVVKLQSRQAPYEIPQIYQGVRFLVYCMLAKGVEPGRTITLSAISQDGPMKLEVPVDPVALQGSKIHTLAARRLIQDLEDGKSFLHLHPKFEGKHVGISLVKKQIIDLAIKHNIASRHTSFLAIDEERGVEMDKDNEIKKRIIPQHFVNNPFVAQGGGFFDTRGFSSALRSQGVPQQPQAINEIPFISPASNYLRARSPSFDNKEISNYSQISFSSKNFSDAVASNYSPTSLSSAAFGSAEASNHSSTSPSESFIFTEFCGNLNDSSAFLFNPNDSSAFYFNSFLPNEDAKKSENPTIPDLDLLYRFLRLQSFDGKFLPTEEFYSYFDLGKKNNNNGNDLREFGIKNNIDEVIWTTSVAIKYLEIVMGEKYLAESEMCREKAENALRKMIGEGEEGSTKILEIAQGWINEWSLGGKDK